MSLSDSQSGFADFIADTIHRLIVSLEAGPCGGVVEIKSWSQVPLSGLVRSRYHLRERMGHQSLSDWTDDIEAISGMKISGGVKTAVWFLVRNEALGTRRTPPGSHRMWPGWIVSAWISHPLQAEAAAMRKASSTENCNSDDRCVGS